MKKLYTTILHLDRREALHKIYKPSADKHYQSKYWDKFYHQRITITMQDFETGKELFLYTTGVGTNHHFSERFQLSCSSPMNVKL